MKLLDASPVGRITVDEILDRVVARLLVAPLVRTRKKSLRLDTVDIWEDEVEVYLETRGGISKARLYVPDGEGGQRRSTSDDVVDDWVRRAMRLDHAFPPHEGRVYLVGRFKRPTGKNPTEFKVSSRTRAKAMRIDDIDSVKAAGKDAYRCALRAGESHGEKADHR